MAKTRRLSQAQLKWLLISGILLLIIIVILAVFLKREPYTVWTEDAAQLQLNKHGHLLGLSTFYSKHFPDTPQQAWRSWKKDEPTLGKQQQHLLFIQETQGMTEAQFQQLLTWVSQGNHVVMPVLPHQEQTDHRNDEDDVASPLTEEWEESESLEDEESKRANVAQWAQIEFKPRADKKTVIPNNPSCKPIIAQLEQAYQRTNKEVVITDSTRRDWMEDCALNLSTITLPEGKTLLWLNDPANPTGFVVKPSKRLNWQSQGTNGSHIVQLKHGQGSVTLVSSMNAFGNPKDPRQLSSDLNRVDHTYLAAYLAQDKQAIWFIHHINSFTETSSPLWKKLWQFSPLFCLCLLILLVLFIWHSGKRQGVVKTLSQHENRQLHQYLQAQGEFLWNHQSKQHILSQLQQELWQEWQRRIPGLSLMNRPEQLAALERIVPAKNSDLALWLQAVPSQPTKKQWLAYLQAHQNIRNAV